MTRLAWWPLSRPARERVPAAAGSTAGSGMKQRDAVISGPPAGTTVRASNSALLATPGRSHQPGRGRRPNHGVGAPRTESAHRLAGPWRVAGHGRIWLTKSVSSGPEGRLLRPGGPEDSSGPGARRPGVRTAQGPPCPTDCLQPTIL